MKYFFLLPALMLVCTCASAQKKVSGIAAAELARFKAMTQKDTQAIKGLVSKDLIYVHSNGLTETYPDFLHSVGAGGILYRSIVPESAQIVRWRRTAVINGTIQVGGELKGSPFNVKLKYLSVYRKQHGHWRLVRWESTKV
jgi:Domain of unknown function (DUF4440)